MTENAVTDATVATEHTVAPLTTEHTVSSSMAPPYVNREPLHSRVAWWRTRAWCKSGECQHLVRVLLTLGTQPSCQTQLTRVLAATVPPFLKLGSEEAFFAALQDPGLPLERAISDDDLRAAVLNFLVDWPNPQRLATYSELCADPHVSAMSTQRLPNGVSLSKWIEKRMHPEMELREVIHPHSLQFYGTTIHMTRLGLRTVVALYKAKRAG